VLFLLSGANLGSDIFYYVWKFIAAAIGLFLITISGGTLLVKEKMNRRETYIYFTGLVLVGLTPALLLYSQLAQNIQLEIWWIIPTLGGILLTLGAILILWSWILQKQSMKPNSIIDK
jgi:protein-S-isoprenylcysteine O-methyltransferase Ste14